MTHTPTIIPTTPYVLYTRLPTLWTRRGYCVTRPWRPTQNLGHCI